MYGIGPGALSDTALISLCNDVPPPATDNLEISTDADICPSIESGKNVKKQAIPTYEICEKCGAGMVIKFGRFGQFLACANYPECKTTREVSTSKSKTQSDGGGDQTPNTETQKKF